MKTKTFLLILIFSVSNTSYSQLLVSEPALVTEMGISTGQLIAINSAIQKMNVEMSSQSQILTQISQSLQELNQKIGAIERMDTDLINSKRIAPEYVHSSSEVQDLINIKEKAVSALKSIKKSVNSLEKLTSKEINDFKAFYSNTLSKISTYFMNSQSALNTGSIINPEERLKIIKRNTYQIENILDEIIEIGSILEGVDKGRRNNSLNTNF